MPQEPQDRSRLQSFAPADRCGPSVHRTRHSNQPQRAAHIRRILGGAAYSGIRSAAGTEWPFRSGIEQHSDPRRRNRRSPIPVHHCPSRGKVLWPVQYVLQELKDSGALPRFSRNDQRPHQVRRTDQVGMLIGKGRAALYFCSRISAAALRRYTMASSNRPSEKRHVPRARSAMR